MGWIIARLRQCGINCMLLAVVGLIAFLCVYQATQLLR